MPSTRTKLKHEQASELSNPYIGPHSYQRGDKHLFVGREQEADRLLSLIITEGIVLFYAQSGAGKSSLVNAKLIPKLEARNFEVLPVVRIGSELPPEIPLETVQNVYIFNLLWNLVGCKKDPKPLLTETLKSFLVASAQTHESQLEYQAVIPDERPSSLTPADEIDVAEKDHKTRVLVIDQFEEILTTHPKFWDQREAFFRQINEAIEA